MSDAAAQDRPENLLRAGITAYREGNFAGAAERFAQVLALAPGHLGARINLANALWSAGDLPGAAEQARIARVADPGSAEAWMITGAIRLDGGDAEGAAASYRQAAKLKPEMAGAAAGLAAAELAAGRFADAEQEAARALALAPGSAHALFTLASAKLALKRPEAALKLFDSLLAMLPNHARGRHNRGNALLDLGRLEEAEAALRAAVALDPGLKEAWASLGYLLTIQEDLPGAIAACDAAVALDKDFAVGQWNRGVALLLNGDFAGGFAAYEWRKRHPVFSAHFTRLPGPVWQGEDLAGRHLLVRAEQGFGDTIMLARFLPRLARQAGKLTLSCPPALFPLFRQMRIELRALNAPQPTPDFAVDQMSLPHILQVTEANIPDAGGYLSADADRARGFAPFMPGGRFRVGVVWAGNPEHNNDRHRSLPEGALTEMLAMRGVEFVSLQLGVRAHEYRLIDAGPLIRDYGDTAAIVSLLDGVVCVDTSVAHLAGALGVPCHVLVSKACDWRWQLGRGDTAWYESLVLHRQERLDEWGGPVAGVMGWLRSRGASAA